MAALRTVLGLAAIAAIAYALNVFVLRENALSEQVLIPMAVGLGLGVLWLLVRLLTLAGTSRGATLRGINTTVGTAAMLGICVTLYAFVLRHDQEWDLTLEGRRELAPQTVQVLESLNREVSVHGIFVKTGDPLVDVAQDKTRRFLERCAEISPMLRIAFIDPQREPEALETLEILRVSEVGTLLLQSGSKRREIPLSDVTGRIEERQFTNALINVARDSQPNVYYLTGHGERDLASEDPKVGALRFRLWMEHEGYAVVPFSVPVDVPAIPRDCSVLVINGYESDVAPHETQALDDYVANGGRLLVLIDPQIVLTPAGLGVEQMRPWLEKRFGIRVNADVLVSQATSGYQALFVHDFSVLGEAAKAVEPSNEFRGSFNRLHPVTRTLDKQVVLSLARTVSLVDEPPENALGTVLLRSTPDAWAEQDLAAVVQRRPISPDDDEVLGLAPVAVAVSMPGAELPDGERVRDARIVVVGDAGLTTNEDINFAGNQNFLLNALAWLSEQEQLIAIRPTGEAESPIVLTPRDQRLIAWVAVLGTVQAVGAAGFAAYFWRRRYR